ncbi:MAG: hypothetical protein K0U86_24140 [Planctomycetes bacterium]|nr:hypothetical protein [Planctomycetota bacterium]MCH9728006.1 hypothetical protein [Planctomycetota bacterium]MCH9775808.1 hypothetical protein [Planctomycetota bacterium]
MKHSEYPNLNQFFACYFNQDWDYEYTTWEEVVEGYVSEVSLMNLNQTIIDFSVLMKSDFSDKKLERVIGGFGCDIYPPGSADGLTYREWIVLIRNELIRLRDSKYSE